MEAVKPGFKSCRAGGLKLASAACTGLLGAMGTAAAPADGQKQGLSTFPGVRDGDAT